ncbi:CPBP family intramembrane glutamic endopeptidase [Neobacillus sp. Marseille-QA0830]
MKRNYLRVAVLCFIQIAILAVLMLGGLHKYIESSNTYIFALSTIFGSLLSIGATWLFYKLVDKKQLKTMNLKLDRKQVQFTILSLLLTVGLSFLVTVLMTNGGFLASRFNSDFSSNINVIPMFLISAVAWFLVGFNEEIMYRGYMVANLKHLPVSKLFLISSLFFAVSHVFVDGLNPVMLGVTLSAAITLMYVYLKTGSLMTAVIPHLIYDFLTRQLIADTDISIMVIEGTPSDLYYAALHVVFLAIQIILVKVMYKQKLAAGYLKLRNATQSV